MKVVLSAAVMDLCHKGHLSLLRKMREEAGDDGLVVMILHDDRSIYETKGKIPVQNLGQRMNNLRITGLVDRVVSCSDYKDLGEKIQRILDQYSRDEVVFMRGDDWDQFPARKVLDDRGVTIKFVPYTQGVSSTEIRSKLENL